MTLAIQRHLRTLVAVSILATPAVAWAQIGQAPAPGIFPSYTHRNSLAFDPVNNVYMAVVWDPPFGPILSGRFVDKLGNPIGTDFVIAIDDVDGEGNPAFASWSSIAFGGPPNDPAFIVTYVVSLDGSTGIKYARLVRYVNGVASVTPRVVIADVGGQWFASEKAQSFWNGQRFVVGTRLHLPGFSFPSPTVNLVDMALNVSPNVNLGDGADFYGSPALACGDGTCLAFGFKAGISGGFSGGSYGRLFSATTLVPQGSGVIPVQPLGANEDQGVVYQKHTGMFLTHWFRVAGGWIDTRVVLPDGTLGATNTAAGPNAGMNTFSYNQFTQTTLLTFKDSSATLYAWELGDQGTPIRPNNFLTLTAWDGAINDYLPSIAANEEDGQWFVTFRLASSSFGAVVTGTYVDPTSVPLTILSNGNMAPATQTLPYAQLMLASGGVIPYTWTRLSGALPPGMQLNGAHLTGTPTTAGVYSFRLRVTSTDLQVAERDFTLEVQAIISVPPGGTGAHIEGATPLYLSQALGKRNNLAYDPINRVYLTTVSDGQMPIVGRWVDRNGLIGWAPDFNIADEADPNDPNQVAFMGFFGITFGGPANDPVFLVTYIVADNAANTKYGRFVRYSNGSAIVSARFPIVNVGTEWLASEKAQSFWNGQRFVVGTRVMAAGHSLPTPQVQLMDLNGNVSAPVVLGDGADFYGSPALSCAANGVCIAIGFKAGIPTGYTGGSYARRFQGASLAPLGSLVTLAANTQNEDQGVVYQTHTGHFLAQWWRSGGYIDTRLIGTDGSMSLLDLSRGIGPDSGDNAIAFNEGTRTSLLVTKRSDAALVVMELGDDGYPINPGNQIVITPWDGSINAFYPSIASNNTDRQWMVTSRLTVGMVGRVIQGSPTGTSLPVQNWNFSIGMAGWSPFGAPAPTDFVTTINNGVLEFYRLPLPPGTPGQGVILQALGVPLAAGAPLAAEFDIGNSSTVRKRITVILHDLDFSDLQMCTFWLDAGAPLRTYRIRTHATRNWANATIAFYAANTGSDGGAYRLDNVRVYSMPGQAVDRTECVDPTTPLAGQDPDSGTLLTNGDFSAGLAPWGIFGQLTSQIAGGVFQFARPAGTPAGVVLQPTGIAVPNDTRLTATLSLGNSSGVWKRVTVLVHDLDFTDLGGCTFWLAPGQPLAVHRVKLFTTKAWGNATVSVYPSSVDLAQWILLDDVSLQITPSASLTGTECIEPPPGLAPGGFTSAAAAAERSASNPAQALPGVPQLPADGDRVVWQAIASEAGPQAFLWASPFDLRESIAPVLQFESQLSDGESEAFVEVTRDGVNWIRVARIPSSDEWSTIAVDLAAFSGDVIYERFVYAGAEPVGGAQVDAWAIRAIQVDPRRPRTIQRLR